jgi:hypothetical protein
VRFESVDVSRRCEDKDIKEERKFTKKYTRKKERKIRLDSRVIWKRKTHTNDERK